MRTSPGGLLPAELPGGILIGTAEKQLPAVKFQLGTAFHRVKGNHPPFGVHPDAKDRSGLGKVPCHVRSSPLATASLASSMVIPPEKWPPQETEYVPMTWCSLSYRES